MKERIAILGAGESGTGAALLAKARGIDVFVSDAGSIKEKYKAELTAANIAFEEGGHTFSTISDAGTIVKSPGIPEKAEIVQALKNIDKVIIDEIEFAFRYLKGKVIAITGTNGKTTTTLLTYHLLKEAGLNVALAGNVGQSLARQVATGDHDWYVIEISSFQLDGIMTFKPEVAILLNITPDHLDRYEGMKEYVNSKFRIISQMTSKQHFIYYADDDIIKKAVQRVPVKPIKVPLTFANGPRSGTAFSDGKHMHFQLTRSFSIGQDETTLKGPHNMINTMAAVSAALYAGVSVDAIRAALKTFRNAPHRLEPVATIKGITFINDSKATNVDAVAYALKSFRQPIIWIAGGVDKGNDYKLLDSSAKLFVKALICLGKDNTKLKTHFKELVRKIIDTHNIDDCLVEAFRVAANGDVVLLSPACASFDLFRNYEDRGEKFRQAVLKMKDKLEPSKV